MIHRVSVAWYAWNLGHLGLYLGEVMFYYAGAHHLSKGPYTAKRVYLYQLAFSVLLVGFWMLPSLISTHLIGNDGLALW